MTLGLFIKVAGIISGYFLSGLIVMFLWNALIPVIFGLIALSYWQALGLFILAVVLFKPSAISTSTKK
jgi:hypothetical protein